MKKHFKNSQKGISIYLTIVITATILSIVIGISLILTSEIKIAREIGNSVVSIYAADSGIENALYIDRKSIPMEGTRGFCMLCHYPSVCPNCQGIQCAELVEGGCDLVSCIDCDISFYSIFGDKRYDVNASIKTTVQGAPGNISATVIKSFGNYTKTASSFSRAIEVSFEKEWIPPSEGPAIYNTSAVPRSTPLGVEIKILADISDADGVDPASVIAEIQNPDENTIDTIPMVLYSGNEFQGTYIGIWTGPEGVYYADITACDTLANCTERENV